MNILVIGNGFDLAHNLPTKYTDFLEFVKVLKDLLTGTQISQVNWGFMNPEIKGLIIENVQNTKGNIYSNAKAWLELIEYNFWIEYFQQIQAKENWIDFESEISEIIKSLDNDMVDKDGKRVLLKENIGLLSNPFLQEVFNKHIHLSITLDTTPQYISYEKVRDRLLGDLHKLIRALELYLTLFVENIPINIQSPEIKGIKMDKVISFNYTHTYEKVYGLLNKNIEFIHGEANLDNDIETNTMVLGIDEYLPEDRNYKEIDFIGFKKYFQRINKGTGCEYKDWLAQMERGYTRNKAIHAGAETISNLVYIFGHSLDVTDADVLRSLIITEGTLTNIFSVDKKRKAQQIANLAKVLGPNELINRTGGQTKSIFFIQQKPMESK